MARSGDGGGDRQLLLPGQGAGMRHAPQGEPLDRARRGGGGAARAELRRPLPHRPEWLDGELHGGVRLHERGSPAQA
eukprot:10369330-Alexandrium_andersonii.AAC.1